MFRNENWIQWNVCYRTPQKSQHFISKNNPKMWFMVDNKLFAFVDPENFPQQKLENLRSFACIMNSLCYRLDWSEREKSKNIRGKKHLKLFHCNVKLHCDLHSSLLKMGDVIQCFEGIYNWKIQLSWTKRLTEQTLHKI